MCHAVGTRGVNSTLTLSVLLVFACAVKAPHIVPVKIIAPMILRRLPEELTTFQVAMESG